MSRELDDDELRALLDRISAERATMKPGEYPEEQPMPDAASPSPSEMEVVEGLLSNGQPLVTLSQAQSALAAMRVERDEAWNKGYAARDGVVDACRAQVLRLTEENEALRKGKVFCAKLSTGVCDLPARIKALEEALAHLAECNLSNPHDFRQFARTTLKENAL